MVTKLFCCLFVLVRNIIPEELLCYPVFTIYLLLSPATSLTSFPPVSRYSQLNLDEALWLSLLFCHPSLTAGVKLSLPQENTSSSSLISNLPFLSSFQANASLWCQILQTAFTSNVVIPDFLGRLFSASLTFFQLTF